MLSYQTPLSFWSLQGIAFAVPMNPYEPSNDVSSDAPSETSPRHHLFAGWWLIVAGVILFFVANRLVGAVSISSVVWSPIWLTLLGVLVLFQFHFASVIARLIGSFTIVAVVLALVLFFAGLGSENDPVEANASVDDPPAWQVALALTVLAGTFLPPWWALQKLVSAKRHPQT
ncbi:MAG: hypothetical protein ACF8AM_15385 [Rhodopirellula sp. JB055]|uniref:hypothetical protein n=1 Tax=Rhodopirellula sp. JB055 TaxID=3342846 RepID=UPI00370B84C8